MILLLWAIPVHASYLKDIRIGEYGGFTRIVFELDTPVSSQHINPQSSGQLVVTLNQTEPSLMRKIPVERSKHVRSIQLWQRGDHLSTHFQLDYDHFRFEYFPLTDPPRLALDVYPLVAPATPSHTVETKREESQIREIRESTIGPSKKGIRETPSPTDPSARDSIAVAKIKEGTPPGPLEQADPRTLPASSAPKEAAQSPNDASAISYTPNTAPRPVQKEKATANGLQFYLVIILVAITIGILALLLIMLLSKRRWTDEKNEMNVNEFLKNQDKHIASLNTRINEQLKRYKEAG